MARSAQRKPASRRKAPRAGGAWLRQHRSSITDTRANFRTNRGAIVLSILVIGITMALPLGLQLLQSNILVLVETLGSRPHATLFLEREIPLGQARDLADSLARDRRLGEITLIDREQALAEFADSSGLENVLASLPSNPLPHTLVIEIDAEHFLGQLGNKLEAELRGIDGVAAAKFDITWVRRLDALSDLTARLAVAFATILGIGVILITGNTIRVGIHSRRDEIEVIKLCGATDAFVRRPFLYSGAAQGFGGAVVAILVVATAAYLLGGPLDRLAGLYGTAMQPTNIKGFSALVVLSSGSTLGWFGAWISVSVYLRELDITQKR